MRLLFGVVLVVGLALAGFAVYMAQSYISQYQTALAQERAAQAKQIKLTEIYIAARPLKYGEPLKKEDAIKVKWPAEAVPEGAFKSQEELFAAGSDQVRTVLRAMEKHEPLLAVKLTKPGEEAGITSRLSDGMRAFAINVDVSSGVSGFLRPGDRVDVYWTGTVQSGGDERRITKLIQAGMHLIAVDQTADKDRYNPIIARTVTVEATPQQVASLAQAQSSGKLALSLVGALDQTQATAVQVDQAEMLGLVEKAPVAAAPEPEPACTIRTRRGSELVIKEIPCTN